jgi:site-specific DNA-methyltransferase (adenine-specific)
VNPNRRKSTISKDEFLEFTKSVWSFQAERAKQIGHPAPFPVDLPYRLIQLYTFKDDIVLDPFAGSGTVAISALKTGRNYILYDNNNQYCQLAQRRIEKFIEEQKTLFESKTV